MLQSEILATQRELGRDSTIRPPLSAFEGTTLVLDVLRELGDGIGRFTVRGIESSYYAGKGGREDEVVLKLDLTFRGDGTVQAGRRYQDFLETLREKPWYIEHKDVKETTLETMDGIYMDGLTITIDPSRAESPVAESTESTREEASS
jgi:hypothetical protein